MEKSLHVHRSFFMFIMRVAMIPVLIVLTCSGMALATETHGQEALNRRISLDVENQEMITLLNKIEEAAGVRFIYSPEVVPVHEKVSLKATNDELDEVLQRLFSPYAIAFEAVEDQIVLRKEVLRAVVPAPPLQPVDRTITGTVTDETNAALPGVSVLVKGTSIGTVTDADGKYTLSIPTAYENDVLLVSFIGYATQEIQLSERTQLDIQMIPDIRSLEEVVVVGASLKEKDLTGAVVSVNQSTLSERPVGTINEALQGRATGVYIRNSPEPGGNASIRVRGNNSMQYGASPIYVVDGVVMERDFNMINLSDVASINVLKDASSTALYGSRGANGVVIITTKKGKNGEGKVTYDGWMGVQDFLNENLTLGAKDMYNLRIDALENAASVGGAYYAANPNATRQNFIDDVMIGGGRFAPYELRTIAQGRSYNWLDKVTRSSAVQQNHVLGFSGGTDKGNYYISLGYLNQQGLVQSSGFKRYTGRINAEQSIKPWLKVGTNTSFSRTEEDLVDGQVFEEARGANPMLNSDTTSLRLAWGDNWNQDNENPVNSLRIAQDRSKNRFFSSNYLSVNPIKGLTVRTNLTVDFIDQQFYEYIPNDIQQSIRDNWQGQAKQNADHVFNFQWDNSITYAKQFGEHALTFLASTSVSRNQFKWTNTMGRGFPINDFGYDNLGAAYDKANFAIGSDYTRSSLMSYLGRVNYEYGDRYMATITARYDGSSKFAPANRWGWFPSISLAWNIANEGFLADQELFDVIKLRAGWGRAGNQNIPDYAYYTKYNAAYSNGAVEFRPSDTRGNRDLTWEKQDQLNIGTDLAVLNNRIQLSLDYFHIKNSNLLMERSLSTTSGFAKTIENIGEMTNRGVEASVNAAVVQTDAVLWNVSANISADKNKVTRLYGDVDAIYKLGGYNNNEIQREGNYFVGQSINTIYMLQFDRIMQTGDKDYVAGLQTNGKHLQPGDILPRDQQKPGEPGYGIIDQDDKVVIGKKDPKFYGGFSSNVSWKGFSLNALFTYSYGAKALSWYYEQLTNGTGYTAAHKDMLDRWTPENTDTNIPRATFDTNERYSSGETSWGVQNASYLRLSTVTLAYTLPKTVIGRTGLSDARIYVTGNNLKTWTKYKGYDPENGDGYPTARMFVVGVNLGF
jgi:TonB-linked SusC/RagA family outer membrane protein